MIMLIPLLLLASAEPPYDCEIDQMTQQGMNYCAYQDYLVADAKLNAQWSKTATVMKQRDADFDSEYDDRPGYFDTLLAAQRAWIAYRDTQCASEGYYARGGSLEPLLVSTCKTKLTEDRTEQLRFLIEQ